MPRVEKLHQKMDAGRGLLVLPLKARTSPKTHKHTHTRANTQAHKHTNSDTQKTKRNAATETEAYARDKSSRTKIAVSFDPTRC